MARTIQFTVYGKPQQRGSKTPWVPRRKDGTIVTRADGRPLIATMDDNKQSQAWMSQVRSAAAEEFSGDLLTGPIVLIVSFFFARPKGHFGTGRNAGVLKSTAPRKHTQKPDLSKLIRTVEDALTGVVWRDDSQVCEYGLAWKSWTTEQARAEIVITEMQL